MRSYLINLSLKTKSLKNSEKNEYLLVKDKTKIFKRHVFMVLSLFF